MPLPSSPSKILFLRLAAGKTREVGWKTEMIMRGAGAITQLWDTVQLCVA